MVLRPKKSDPELLGTHRLFRANYLRAALAGPLLSGLLYVVTVLILAGAIADETVWAALATPVAAIVGVFTTPVGVHIGQNAGRKWQRATEGTLIGALLGAVLAALFTWFLLLAS